MKKSNKVYHKGSPSATRSVCLVASLLLHAGVFAIAGKNIVPDTAIALNKGNTPMQAVFISQPAQAREKPATTKEKNPVDEKVIYARDEIQQANMPPPQFDHQEHVTEVAEIPAKEPLDEKQAEPEEVPAKDVDEPWKKHQEKFASQPQSEACQSEDAAPCDYYNREVVGSTVVDQTPTAIVQPPPPYPRIAIRRNLEGTVELEVLVCSNGKPINVRVKRSSGYRFFDQSALDTVARQWLFKNSSGRQNSVVVSLHFKLE